MWSWIWKYEGIVDKSWGLFVVRDCERPLVKVHSHLEGEPRTELVMERSEAWSWERTWETIDEGELSVVLENPAYVRCQDVGCPPLTKLVWNGAVFAQKVTSDFQMPYVELQNLICATRFLLWFELIVNVPWFFTLELRMYLISF